MSRALSSICEDVPAQTTFPRDVEGQSAKPAAPSSFWARRSTGQKILLGALGSSVALGVLAGMRLQPIPRTGPVLNGLHTRDVPADSGVGSGKYTDLVWSDEFDGSTLDTSLWNIALDCNGGGNNELQCYTSEPQNLQLSGNGTLLISVDDHQATEGDGQG